MDEKTKLLIEGVLPNLTNVGTKLVENRKVNLTAIGQRALSLEIVTKYEGTLSAVNSTSRTIVLKLKDGGQTITLPYPQLVDLFGKTNPSLSDVPVGSNVTASLTTSQDLIAVLKVKTVLQVEAATVNSGTNRVSIKWNGGPVKLILRRFQ